MGPSHPINFFQIKLFFKVKQFLPYTNIQQKKHELCRCRLNVSSKTLSFLSTNRSLFLFNACNKLSMIAIRPLQLSCLYSIRCSYSPSANVLCRLKFTINNFNLFHWTLQCSICNVHNRRVEQRTRKTMEKQFATTYIKPCSADEA